MLVETISELRAILRNEPSVGFVPTMGFLHEGHLSLIKAAKAENKKVVVSIFVNPTQFAPNEDFDSYPRDIKRDYDLAMGAGADYIFYPTVDEIYVDGASTSVIVEGDISTKLCGASRPTHFKGVTSIVNTLFNIVQPNRAYFGQKDAQQAIIIKKMVRELHMDVDVIVCPIIREKDGLAMSSRNTYLDKNQRAQAIVLNQSLKLAFEAVKNGQTNVATIKDFIYERINTAPLANIEYVDILNARDLSNIETINDTALAAAAVKFGKTRLIDNILLEVK